MIFYNNRLYKVDTSTVFVPDELDDGQLLAADRMADGNHWLMSDPGAGKTLTALQAYCYCCYDKEAKARMIVVCPIIAMGMWAATCEKVLNETKVLMETLEDRYSPVTIQIIRNNTVEVLPQADILIVPWTVYGKPGPHQARFFDFKPDCIAMDESDVLASHDSQRTKAALIDSVVTNSCSHVWPMTGTPIPRYADGLWPTLRYLFLDRLKSYTAINRELFVAKFCHARKVKYSGMRFPKEVISSSKNHALLHELLFGGNNPIATRNKLVLPPYIEHVTDLSREFTPSSELAVLMESLEEIEYDDDGFPVTDSGAQTTALRMLGIESSELIAGRIGHAVTANQKLMRCNSTTLCLFWHKDVMNALNEYLTNWGYKTRIIHGGTSDRNRDKYVEEFNSGKIDILLGQIKAMGVALNLQMNCNQVCVAEETWSHAWDLQAIQRVWRRGQSHTVKVNRYDLGVNLSKLKPRVISNKAKDAALILDRAHA